MAGQSNARRLPRNPANGLISQFLSNKLMQVLLIICILSAVFLFYNFATTKQDFTVKSRELYKAENQPINVKSDREEQIAGTFEGKQAKAAKTESEKHAREYENDYHVLFIFSKMNPSMKGKFNTAFGSLFEHARFDDKETFHMHFVCEADGREFIEDYFKEHISHPSFSLKVHFHDTKKLAREVNPKVKGLQAILGNDHDYFSDTAIFYLSLALHTVMPESVHRMVQLDVDLKFKTNIRDIWSEFKYFKKETLIGIANENQPVY
uniref:Uncharacterized protein n=1 Tax=Ciona savignyi TaxID=51511 RepID=H2Z3T6_CIOSA